MIFWIGLQLSLGRTWLGSVGSFTVLHDFELELCILLGSDVSTAGSVSCIIQFHMVVLLQIDIDKRHQLLSGMLKKKIARRSTPNIAHQPECVSYMLGKSAGICVSICQIGLNRSPKRHHVI